MWLARSGRLSFFVLIQVSDAVRESCEVNATLNKLKNGSAIFFISFHVCKNVGSQNHPRPPSVERKHWRLTLGEPLQGCDGAIGGWNQTLSSAIGRTFFMTSKWNYRMLKLKLGHGDLWSVVSQQGHHQTLEEETVVTISRWRIQLEAKNIPYY